MGATRDPTNLWGLIEAMDVTKPYNIYIYIYIYLLLEAMDVTNSFKFIGFEAMDATKTYKFNGFGAIYRGPGQTRVSVGPLQGTPGRRHPL